MRRDGASNRPMSVTNEVPPESTGETPVGFEHWLTLEKTRIAAITARYHDMRDQPGQSMVDFVVTTTDGKQLSHRIPLGEGKVEETARMWVADLAKRSGLTIPLTVFP